MYDCQDIFEDAVVVECCVDKEHPRADPDLCPAGLAPRGAISETLSSAATRPGTSRGYRDRSTQTLRLGVSGTFYGRTQKGVPPCQLIDDFIMA